MPVSAGEMEGISWHYVGTVWIYCIDRLVTPPGHCQTRPGDCRTAGTSTRHRVAQARHRGSHANRSRAFGPRHHLRRDLDFVSRCGDGGFETVFEHQSTGSVSMMISSSYNSLKLRWNPQIPTYWLWLVNASRLSCRNSRPSPRRQQRRESCRLMFMWSGSRST